MNIATFITARLDERMAALRALEDAHCQGFEMSTQSGAVAFSTRTEMADIQAKRRIVEMTPVVRGLGDPLTESWHMLVLGHLASVYAEHEDYFVGWKP